MKNITREEFLKTSSLAIAATFIPQGLFSSPSKLAVIDDKEIMKRLVIANDRSVEEILDLDSTPQRIQNYRSLSYTLTILTSSFFHPKSSYFESEAVFKAMGIAVDKLLDFQYANGTLDAGGNRMSPPDTAFLVEVLYPAAWILRKHENQENTNLKTRLDDFLKSAGEGIRQGGVHTPNHRWIISSVLAKLYDLYGDRKYVERLDQWLAEGIYQNSDGNYPERSRNYAVVENEAFITIGHLLDRPELFEIVAKNLRATYYYMEADGEMVSLDSRRQDQFKPISALKNYLCYRFMANHENDDLFASIARTIERLEDFEKRILSSSLGEFMSSPILMQEMPKEKSLPTNYTKYFEDSDLVRIKRGGITASIFAGNDLPLTVASGRSCNPTFFTFRKNAAILEYARLSSNFFNTGYIRGQGIKRYGNRYVMEETKEAYYYQPMPALKSNEKGDYILSESLDGRFWSKMDFPSRPKNTLTLESKIVVEERDNKFDIEIEVNGPENVEVTLDLCFRAGGKIEGDMLKYGKSGAFLEEGSAKYTYNGDSITIGPGLSEHYNIRNLDGEVYSTHFGSIRGIGEHLFISALVPFKHTLTIG